ncbi:GGDEF domain-containing protein [Marinomonas posidonica]|uniref:diguanylate cyclase n=1 Tax=Marinomonas posidonica (strain CECT 7376 / NCIMB 14433 / IVIA-Po-181) TaxID=491952 RepID=F6CWH0_MARPP|nr:GGDEF domain-containing protein [Marinomonas posidonica]AEF53225.1 diguanylate cyclase [Marinomonas posidonica IVIA-Po-181]
MRLQNDEEQITISALQRLLWASFFSSLMYAAFFHFFPTPLITDSLIPTLISGLFLALLAFLNQDPHNRISKVITIYVVLTLSAFIPATWIHVWLAWQGEQHRLIDFYPPISGVIIAILTLGLTILPKEFKKYIVLSWACTAIPLVHYLVLHPLELHTRHSYELLGLWGPGCLLLYMVAPYQKSIRNHMLRVATDLQRSELEADRDFLTDTYNRRGLQNWLAQLKHDDLISLALIDVDHFKRVNDTYGHDMGDQVLVEFASRLRTIYRGSHIIGRWGGEEFIAVFINPDSGSMAHIADQFQIKLSQLPYQDVGQITACVGMSHIAHHEHFLALINQADKALYHAKHNGRNQAVLFSDIEKTIKPHASHH